RGSTLASARPDNTPRRVPAGFPGDAKVKDRLAFRSEDFAMLVGILRQHTAADRCDFKAAHYMAVAIGASNQAQVHFSRGRQSANDLWWFCPQSGCSKGRIPFPVPARHRDRRSVTHKLRQKRRPVGIGASHEQNIVSRKSAELDRPPPHSL